MRPEPTGDRTVVAIGDDRRQNSLRVIATLIGVLAGLAAVLWLLGRTGGDGPADAPDAPLPIEDPAAEASGRGSDAATRAQSGPGSESGATGGAVQPGEAGSASRSDALGARLAYLTEGGVAIMRLAVVTDDDGARLAVDAVDRVRIKVSGAVLPLNEYALLTDGNRTVGLSMGDSRGDGPFTAVVVASAARVVPDSSPLVEYWVIDRRDDHSKGVLLVAWHFYGFMSGDRRVPPGSDLVVTGEPGILVVPPTGKTFRAVISGFEPVSEHRALAAGGGVRVEQRCDDQLVCEVVAVDLSDGRVTVLPDDFIAELGEISVSPGGRWLLNDTSPALLYDRTEEEPRQLQVGGYGRAQWTRWPLPEAHRDQAEPHFGVAVGWLTTDRTPSLVLARADAVGGPEVLVVELSGLDADPVPGSSFVLW